ncbi:MAG: MiaB/RimO family radical SAM methylthiotransferase [Coriobacteriia bacterium]|nr:MiaB/RimO family radical SAM methylthiotransferase [Coriobacteriia bacterium]
MSKKFYIKSLGCKVNRAEADDFAAYLLENGWEFSSSEEADLILINTCTVTHTAEKKTRKAVKSLCTTNKKAKIILTGCSCVIHSDFYKSLDSRIEIISKKDLDVGCASILANEKFRTRASIKIQDGCDNACTYCIVHVARGKSVSLDKKFIINRFNELSDSGVKEVVLTGVNLGAYNDLCGLLTELLHSDTRIRLSSIEPQNLTDDIIDLIADSDGKICRHLHLPLQSGSSRILKKMARHYNADEYLSLVYKLREKIPTIALSTDIIVGFPGEDSSDFKQSFDLCNKCGFMKIHVFPYSVRVGTPAAIMPNQIPEDIKQKRAKNLRELSKNLAIKDFNARKGSSELVLVESKEVSRTESYHTIASPKASKPGELISVIL